MRTKIRVLVVLATATFLAALVGMQSASSQTVLNLVLPADTQKVRAFDTDDNGLRLGDRVAARGPLTDADGTAAGMSYAECVVQRRILGSENGLWLCTYVLDLADGELVVKGLDPRGPGDYEMAVLGGTGAYANASGDATFTDTTDETQNVGRTEMLIRLSN